MNFGLNFAFLGMKKHAYPSMGVPKVLRSEILPDTPDGIKVTWDRPMMMTCDIKNQIKVIHGAVETAPTSVIFSPDKTEMGIVMDLPFTPGEVVTWAYDNTGGCDLQQVEVPNTEADNQTYNVLNQAQGVTLSVSADSTMVSVDNINVTVDEG